MKREFEAIWKEIEQNFDFEKVYQVMKALDWHWYMGVTDEGDEINGIPTVKYIKIKAKHLCHETYIDGGGHSTGGFSTGIENDEIYLIFTIDESSAIIEES